MIEVRARAPARAPVFSMSAREIWRTGGWYDRHGSDTKMRRTECWCIAPEQYEPMPPEDAAIAQLLHLRADPAKLRQMANVFPG